jgi:dimethylhistidine N-methyltransferase
VSVGEGDGGVPAVDDHGHTEAETFLDDVIAGFESRPRSIPTKYLYDERGSELFDRICELKAYYPTRTEAEIFDTALPEVAERIGPRAFVIEPGAGSGTKTTRLMRALDAPAAVAVVDISMMYAEGSAAKLAEALTGVEVFPVCADFTQDHDVPDPSGEVGARVVFFPGSTVGNFTPEERTRLLRAFRRDAGRNGWLLMGFDLRKDRETLELAYDDPEGVTAAFNLNLLERANREIGTNFDLDAWSHRATWNPSLGRVELEVVSGKQQDVTVGDRAFTFDEGEAIYTESSHKFEIESFGEEMRAIGFEVERVWTDDRDRFAVALARGV